MKVRCVNSANKPKSIPDDQWIKEGEIYTVTRVVQLALQQDRLGLILEEIKLTDCFPYEFYDSNRFEPVDNLTEKEIQKARKEADLDSVS
jgi:hypothetical protein